MRNIFSKAYIWWGDVYFLSFPPFLESGTSLSISRRILPDVWPIFCNSLRKRRKNPDTLFKLVYIVVCHQSTYWYYLDKTQSVCICKCKKFELLYSKMKLNMWLQQNIIRFGKQTHPKKLSMSISLLSQKYCCLYRTLIWSGVT